jgi:hypothetical protein
MYKPPIPPVIRPAQGPAMTPLRKIGNWVRCIVVENGPTAIGIMNGGSERIFDKATINAAKVRILVFIEIINR